MLNLWTLGGLSVRQLLARTARESWEDSVFGQGGRMAFYQFLAIFPSLIALLAVSARLPHLGVQLKYSVQRLSGEMLPDQVLQLLGTLMNELQPRAFSALRVISICAAAAWAAFNSTWAMIYGLNRAYEVAETRSWRQLAVTNVALTAFTAATGLVAVLASFYAAGLGARLDGGAAALRALEWSVVIVALSVSLSVLYRFAPNIHHEWRWSTPGALCALILWIAASFGARIYFGYINDYSRSYGFLNGVAILLLWLYLVNGAILIGGEMNSEIEKAATERHGT